MVSVTFIIITNIINLDTSALQKFFVRNLCEEESKIVETPQFNNKQIHSFKMEDFSRTFMDVSDNIDPQKLVRLSQTETKRGSDIFDDSLKYISRVNEEFKLSRPRRDHSADSVQVGRLSLLSA